MRISHPRLQLCVFNLYVDFTLSQRMVFLTLFLSMLLVLWIVLSWGTEMKTYELFCLSVSQVEPTPHVQAKSEIQICTTSNCLQRWAQLLFCQVHCISTEFTPRKHGGEKGVPFRVQIDTFKQNENGEYTEHLHSASCQIKVFKVWRSFGFVVH